MYTCSIFDKSCDLIAVNCMRGFYNLKALAIDYCNTGKRLPYVPIIAIYLINFYFVKKKSYY